MWLLQLAALAAPLLAHQHQHLQPPRRRSRGENWGEAVAAAL